MSASLIAFRVEYLHEGEWLWWAKHGTERGARESLATVRSEYPHKDSRIVKVTMRPVIAQVDQARIEAATRRIEAVERELRRWQPVDGQASDGTFGSQIRLLQQARDLLDPKVSLA